MDLLDGVCSFSCEVVFSALLFVASKTLCCGVDFDDSSGRCPFLHNFILFFFHIIQNLTLKLYYLYLQAHLDMSFYSLYYEV